MNRRGKHGWRGFSAWLMLVALAIGQTSTIADFVAMPHGYCLEHGEVVHLSRSPSSADRPLNSLLSVDSARLGAIAHSDADHCQAAVASRQQSRRATDSVVSEEARVSLPVADFRSGPSRQFALRLDYSGGAPPSA